MHPDQVKVLQTFVNQYLPADQQLKVDGYWGPDCKRKCKFVGSGTKDQIITRIKSSIAEEFELFEPTLLAIAKVESGFNPAFKSKTTSAEGLYGILLGTARVIRQLGRDFSFKDRTSIEKSTEAMCYLLKHNASLLKNRSIVASPLKLWTMYKIGPTAFFARRTSEFKLAMSLLNSNLPKHLRSTDLRSTREAFKTHWLSTFSDAAISSS